MKLTALTTIIALTATTALSENYQPQPVKPVPETPIKCCDVPAPEPERDSEDVPWAAIGVIGAIILMATLSNRKQSDPDAPRPNVRPEMCMEKVAGVDVMVACGD